MNDVIQFEQDFIITTKTHHQTPIVHTTSITNVDDSVSGMGGAGGIGGRLAGGGGRNTPAERARSARLKRASVKRMARQFGPGDDGRVTDDSSSAASAGWLFMFTYVLV